MIASFVLGMNSVFQFINVYVNDVNDGLRALGFLFFLTAFFAITLFIILLVDLFNKNHMIVRAKYISSYKNIIYVLKENGQVKKIRIFAPEMLHRFSTLQQVEVTLSAITQIPMHIVVIEADGESG
jgi:hypothetical protein